MDWTQIFSMVGFETVSTQNLKKPNNAKYILLEACLTSKLAIKYLDYKTFYNRLGKYVILGLIGIRYVGKLGFTLCLWFFWSHGYI